MSGQLEARPPNAPPAATPGLGVQPGTSRAVIANFVIVFGTGAGLFIYNGTPGAGNPPVLAAVSPTTTKDPYGNSLPSVGGSPAVLDVGNLAAGQARIGMDQFGDLVAHAAAGSEIWLLPAEPGINIYDATGKLVDSISPTDGFDAGGKPFFNGFSVYTGNTPTDLFASFTQAGINWGLNQNGSGGTGHLKFHAPTGVQCDPVTTWDPVAGFPTAETWHPATLATGWTGQARYMLSAADSRVWLDIDATFTDNGVTHLASGTVVFSLPAPYRPAAAKFMSCGLVPSGAVLAANRVPEIQAGTGGGIFAVNVTTSANAQTAEFRGELSFPLD